jgi:hypothetical protein
MCCVLDLYGCLVWFRYACVLSRLVCELWLWQSRNCFPLYGGCRQFPKLLRPEQASFIKKRAQLPLPHSGTVLCQSTPRPAKIPLAVFLPRPHFASHTPTPAVIIRASLIDPLVPKTLSLRRFSNRLWPPHCPLVPENPPKVVAFSAARNL